MSGLRIEVDLGKIGDNGRELVARCSRRGISVTAVTKAMLGWPDLARTLEAAGVCALGDSRIENIERMRADGIDSPMVLLRSPAISEIDRVVRAGATSANTEPAVLSALADAARASGVIHRVMIMVELGDLREGVMPERLDDLVRHVLARGSLELVGIGANLACRSGVEPSESNMADLSVMVDSVEERFGITVETVSGGNSANLEWALGQRASSRVNNLRLGEAILLGRDPRHRRPILGLHTDAFSIVAEVIESNRKPTRPWGRRGQNAFGESPSAVERGDIWQTILAAGRQDTDPNDLAPPPGVDILAASSDHLIVETAKRLAPGDEIRFEPGYSALLRSMTSPTVSTLETRSGSGRRLGPAVGGSAVPRHVGAGRDLGVGVRWLRPAS